MKVHVEKHCRTWSQLPGPGKEYAITEWPVCSLAAKIFPSSSARKAWRGRPGVGRETFTVSDYSRLMSYSLTLIRLWARVRLSTNVTLYLMRYLMRCGRQWAESF